MIKNSTSEKITKGVFNALKRSRVEAVRRAKVYGTERLLGLEKKLFGSILFFVTPTTSFSFLVTLETHRRPRPARPELIFPRITLTVHCNCHTF